MVGLVLLVPLLCLQMNIQEKPIIPEVNVSLIHLTSALLRRMKGNQGSMYLECHLRLTV